MNDKVEEIVFHKTPGLNSPETYVLNHNSFENCLVLIFSDLNKTQIYKKPYRNSSHHGLEILTSFNFLSVFKPNEHTEDFQNRKPNDENFLFEIGVMKYIHVGEKLTTFETNDITVNKSSDLNFNDTKFPYAYGEKNIYFTLHQKYFAIQEYETSKRV